MGAKGSSGSKYRQHSEQVRNKRLFIRVTPEEHREISERAEALGLSMGAYLMRLADLDRDQRLLRADPPGA